MPGWGWAAIAVVAALVLADQAARRGWLDVRPSPARPPGESVTSGAFGELLEIFTPSRRHVVEEDVRQRHSRVEAGDGAPGFEIDLDSGIALVDAPSARPALREVAPGVWVRHVPTWCTASCVVVDALGQALVIDPALTAAEIADLAAQIGARGWRVVAGLATHVHHDHVLWGPGLGAVPRWASAATVRAARERPAEVLTDEQVSSLGVPRSVLDGLTALDGGATHRLPWTGPAVRVLHHDAHAPGHLALLVEEARVLIAGDMLSAREVPLLDVDRPDPMGDYRDGLELLAAVVEGGGVDAVIPGHGPFLTTGGAIAVIAADRAYLDALARGAEPSDSRLEDPWVREQHEGQVAALGLSR